MKHSKSITCLLIALCMISFGFCEPFVCNSSEVYALEENNLDEEVSTGEEGVPEEELTEGWTRLGTCEWQVDDAGVLTIRPAGNGSEGTMSSTTSSTWGDKRAQIKKAVIAPGVKAGASTQWMFYCPNLEDVEGLNNLDTSDTTDMSAMFHSSKVKTIDLSGLDTSKVTGMRSMFEECRSLESVNLEGLNTTSLRTAYNMFRSTGNFEIIWDGFDLSNVDVSDMFYGSKIENIDFSKVKTNTSTNLHGAFCDCHQLKTADMSGINGSSYGYLFAFCENLTDVDFTGANFNRQSQYYMLYGCNSLTKIPKGFKFTGLGESPFFATGETLLTYYEGCDSNIINYDWNSENRILKATIQHDYEDAVTNPTCISQGYTTHTCRKCGESTVDSYVDALGHDWNSEPTVEKVTTCTEDGAEAIHCTRCDAVKDGSEKAIPKTGHKFGAWKTTKAATEIATGQKTRTCSVCGHVEKQTIAMLKPTLPAVKITTPKAAKKAATIKWKKASKKNQKKIAKIEIQYSLDKSFKTGVKTVYAKKSVTSKKIKRLASKKTYYVRIRAYKNSGGAVHVSKWSVVKKVKSK